MSKWPHIIKWVRNKIAFLKNLSGRLFLMLVQPRQYWIADYSSLFLRVIPILKTTHFLSVFFKMAGELAENIKLFAST